VIVAVLPFLATDQIDPDADALARWLTAGTAAKLADAVEVQQVVDPVGFSAEAIGGAAAALGAQAALGARIKLGGGAVEVSALLANASGVARAEWSESVPLGSAPQLALLLARGVLLGLSEDSLAPPETAEAEMPAEAVLRLARAASLPDPNELLALVEELPAFRAPREALLRAAAEAMGGGRMPEHLAALERLVELRPDDAEALLALGDYRSVHFDEVGARKLFLAARDAAPDSTSAAQALSRLAGIAERAGRAGEAISHLRAAVKLADDGALYGRLGTLLLPKEPEEGLQMLTRATVLAPGDPLLHLRLARALREHGGDPGRTLAAAATAADLCEGQPDLEEEVRTEVEKILSE
jgi:tetratricopeptide (TPR) repeat protein